VKFADGTQVGVMGLGDIMADLYAEDRPASAETAEKILERLEEKNYIPSSERVQREYKNVLLREYRTYIEDRSGSAG
jgi:hypothetical protein